MEESNVNKLNGVSNFGHGDPEKTEEVNEPLTELSAPNMDNDEKEVATNVEEAVASNEGEAEESNG